MNKEIHPRTQQINRDQRAKARKACLDTLKWLATTFPAAFDTTQKVRPLKVGIINDILDYLDKNKVTTVSRSKLRQALVMFTRRMEYLVCLKCREPRIDLNGQPVSEVTDDEASQAREKIRQHVEKNIRIKHQLKKQVAIASLDTTIPIKELKPVTEVMVKKKVARRFDPEAVARLKEKLRLAKTVGQ
jgi:ProP effector